MIPDGALNSLNFETLVSARPRPHYWIEDVIVTVAPALHLVTPQKAISGSRSVLAIGNPVKASPEYPALQFASAEMNSLRKHFGEDLVTLRTGSAATPSIYRAMHPERFPLIHFAAHASANPESPLESAIILSPEDGRFKLYSRDIAATPLAAQLVTVSGCRTAGSRTYAGEGMVGFVWAFMKAGAREVIAGLWDVGDKSTAELMDRLYAGIAAGDEPAIALRLAKLALLSNGGVQSKPYYWAPFQLFTRGYTDGREISRANTQTSTAHPGRRHHPALPVGHTDKIVTRRTTSPLQLPVAGR